jgi:hypothetical protein
METTKINGYQWVCPRCKKQIISVNEAQFSFNKAVHEVACKSTAEAIVEEVKHAKR